MFDLHRFLRKEMVPGIGHSQLFGTLIYFLFGQIGRQNQRLLLDYQVFMSQALLRRLKTHPTSLLSGLCEAMMRRDFGEWEKVAKGLEVDQDEDPSEWPVCEEIPWQQVGPLVERVLDDHFPPEKDESSSDVAEKEMLRVRASASSESADFREVLSLKDQGDEAYEKQKIDVALKAWRSAAKVVQQLPGYKAKELWVSLVCQAAMLDENLPIAESEVTSVLEELPENVLALKTRGLVREKREDWEGSKRDLSKAASLNFMDLQVQEALERLESRENLARRCFLFLWDRFGTKGTSIYVHQRKEHKARE